MNWYHHLDAACMNVAMRRAPDLTIYRQDGKTYIQRWHLIPHNRFFNVYYHVMHQSDDDRALHDHKAHNVSIVTFNGYWEHSKGRRIWRGPGSVVFRRAQTMHRLELEETQWGIQGSSSIFIKLPDFRRWGYDCQDKGWVDAQDYNDDSDGVSKAGKGCG